MNDANERAEAPQPDPFFLENLASLKSWAPWLHSRMLATTITHSKLVRDDGLDLDLLGERLYRMDAQRFADQQVEAFIRSPERHFLMRPNPDRIAGVAGDYAKRMEARLQEAGLSAHADANPASAEFLLIFGVGLGLHVAPLIEHTSAKVVVIVEPNLEFLYHSLHVVDWRSILEDAERSGRQITFLVEKDTKRILTSIINIVRNNNPSQLDGTYLFSHYRSSILERAKEMLRQDFYLVVSGLGHVEDELLMTRNATNNLRGGEVPIFSRYLPERKEPILIIGSGPSVEADLDFLRANNGRAAMLSVGTSLRMLLANGITPDFHVEIENSELSGRMVQANVRDFDAGSVVLVGSATVSPGTFGAFSRCALFFREQVSSTTIFGNGVEVVQPAGPTVANAALIVVIRMGFREIYLFGVDMGSKTAGKYHADDTIYAVGELEECVTELSKVAGNFGGDVIGMGQNKGVPVLDWARIMLENAIAAHRHVRVFNCSDGARIDGALPKLSRAIEFSGEAIDHAKLQAEILSKCPKFTKDMLRQSWHRARAMEKLDGKFAAVDRIIVDAMGEADPDLAGVVRKIYGIVSMHPNPNDVILSYITGTMVLTMACATWFERHLTDPSRGVECRRMALEELLVSTERVREILTEFFGDIDQLVAAAAPTPVAAA